MVESGFLLVKKLKKALLPVRGQSLLLAFSGGVDSLSLGQALSEIANDVDVRWSLVHIDHGSCSDSEQRVFRDQSVDHARAVAAQWNVPFHLVVAAENLGSSEEALRDFRHAALEQTRLKCGAQKILFAHHHDDLLETRLMRLLRGTGPRGLKAMVEISAHTMRPWLTVTKSEIERYAKARDLVALDDPSNKNSTYFRNWIRNEWLPQLDAQRPGSTVALARSLEHLACEVGVEAETSLLGEMPWDRRQFRDLSGLHRRAAVAETLRHVGAKNFSKTHVEEIVKRLDTVQKRLDFVVAGVEFRLNAQQIFISPLSDLA